MKVEGDESKSREKLWGLPLNLLRQHFSLVPERFLKPAGVNIDFTHASFALRRCRFPQRLKPSMTARLWHD